MTTLNLRPPKITISLDVGTTISHTFFYINPDYTPINISAYSAKMKAKLAYTSITPIFDFDTISKGGLTKVGPITTTLDDYLIIPGEKVIYTGTIITNAYGIKLDITSAQTAALTPEVTLLFDIELVSPTPLTYTFLRGTIVPYNGITK
jgi:hypothetical protein